MSGCIGSIPARAGEPCSTNRRMETCWVYPRACGGTRSGQWWRLWRHGLSPRVRGNRGGNGNIRVRLGSIPARAGEPLPPQDQGRGLRVYPRACGGTYNPVPGGPLLLGLSPRVRGNLRPYHHPPKGSWSIPARAGEPGDCCCPRDLWWVYPRACGGTLCARALPPRSGGSIPARAGEPSALEHYRRVVGVYPRACGGTYIRRRSFRSSIGLSPRVRGNP